MALNLDDLKQTQEMRSLCLKNSGGTLALAALPKGREWDRCTTLRKSEGVVLDTVLDGVFTEIAT